MDPVEFERLYETFLAFHAHFAPCFGRKQWRERSRDYLHGLLVQVQERGNAENLAEAVADTSERSLQRFLTDARWDDATVTEQLQAYLGPRLAHPEAVWAVDGSSFPKQGTQSVGVARQYCGALGKIANCQVGVFLAHVGPRGRALVDKRLYLPKAEWAQDPARCLAAGVPAAEIRYQSQSALALELLLQAKRWGHLTAAWVTGDDEFGKSPTFRDGLAGAGYHYVLEVPSTTPVWPGVPTWHTPVSTGHGRPPQPQPVVSERQEVRARAAALPVAAWQRRTVADGAQGPRTYEFAFERVQESRDGKPAGELWLVYRRNLDGTEPRYYFSNAPPDTPGTTLARVSAARWPIETEFEDEKSQVALDEYEVRRWAGWHHHLTMCLLASVFLLTLQQDWGEKDAPDYPAAGLPGGLRVTAARALRAGRLAGLAGEDATAECGGQTRARQTAGALGRHPGGIVRSYLNSTL